MWLPHITFIYLIFYPNIPQLFLHHFKLSILSNYTEHLKDLVPFIIHTISFLQYTIDKKMIDVKEAND